MTQSNNIENIKDWFTFVVAVIKKEFGEKVAKAYWKEIKTKERIEKLEKEITILRQDIQNIRDDNSKILRIVGRLEGKLEN